MTLAELELELDLIVQDAALSAHFRRWLNNALLEIAYDFNLPALKLTTPASLAVTIAGGWLYDMPANYHKNLFRCRNSNNDTVTIDRDAACIEDSDPDHSETGDYVTRVAVENDRIIVYPKAADTLSLWFYQKPETLSAPEDSVVCIPAAYQSRVLISKVVIQNFQLLQNQSSKLIAQGLLWWKNNYKAGLYGEPHGDIGMIQCLARAKKPKRHGGTDPLP